MTAYEDPLGTENYAPSMQLLRFLKQLEVFLVIIRYYMYLVQDNN